MRQDEAHVRVLDAAEELFYARGIRAVGMDEIRSTAGVSLKLLYRCFPSKEELVEACLRRRDERWRATLAEYLARHAGGAAERLPAVFDWLGRWFSEPGFRGCAFINSFGELAASSPRVARVAAEHKSALRGQLLELARQAGAEKPAALADRFLLLVDGATTNAAIAGSPAPAEHAREMAETLVAEAVPRTP